MESVGAEGAGGDAAEVAAVEYISVRAYLHNIRVKDPPAATRAAWRGVRLYSRRAAVGPGAEGARGRGNTDGAPAAGQARVRSCVIEVILIVEELHLGCPHACGVGDPGGPSA